jgi:hypothetical protein
MACGVIRQLSLESETFDVVLIGSLFEGHTLMAEMVGETIQTVAPGASLVRLTAPPVVGGVVLGMQKTALDTCSIREKLIETTENFLKKKIVRNEFSERQ